MVGDFGRAEPGPFSTDVFPAKGAVRNADGKVVASAIVMTDAEQAMRDRIWRFLQAPHSAGWFGEIAAQLQVMGNSKKPLRTDRYSSFLHGDEFSSAAARYNRLGADIADDLATLPETFAAICAVQRLDRQRGLAANQLDLEASLNAGAATRLAENRELAQRFAMALRNRYDSYSYALDHLLVEAPDPAARGIDAQLSTLLVPVEAAESADYCGHSGSSGPVTLAPPIVGPGDGAPRSRFATTG